MLPIGLFFNCACYLHQSAPSHFLKTIAEYISFCNLICPLKIWRGNAFSPLHLVSRERLECPKPYSFLQPYQLFLWSVVPLSLSASLPFIIYILNISEGTLWHTCLDVSYLKSLKIKSHLGNVLPWYFNYIYLRKLLKFSLHLCAISRKLSQAKESLLIRTSFCTEGILSWPTAA